MDASNRPAKPRKWDIAMDEVLRRQRRRPYYTLGSILGSAFVLVLTDNLLMPAAMSHLRVSPVLGFAIQVAIGCAALFIFYKAFDAVDRLKHTQ
jgi:hypothetical protein